MSFIYNGVCSNDMRFNITNRTVYTAPAYDVNAIEVPGRSGALLNSQNRFKNKSVTYTGFIKASDFPGANQGERLSFGTRQLKAWLLSDPGEYHDLYDTYDIGFRRRAYISSELSIQDVLDRPDGATITVTFECEPFMYKDAEPFEFSAAGTLYNPLQFASQPKLEITMTGAGTVTIGGKTWTISSYTGTLYFDPDALDWYDAGALKNSLVSGDGFPELKPGANAISWTGSISKVKIYPRWRTL